MTEADYINCQDLARSRILRALLGDINGTEILDASPIREEELKAVSSTVNRWVIALENRIHSVVTSGE